MKGKEGGKNMRSNIYAVCIVVLMVWGSGLGTIYTVTSTLDDGSPGTLRWAINQANGNSTMDTIYFSPTIAGQTITVTSNFPQITDSLLIDGQTNNITIDASSSTTLWQVTPWSTDLWLEIRNISITNPGGYVLYLVRGNNGSAETDSFVLKHLHISGGTSSNPPVYVENYEITKLVMDTCVIENMSNSYGVQLVNGSSGNTFQNFLAVFHDDTIRNCASGGIYSVSYYTGYPVKLRILGGRIENCGNADYKAGIELDNDAVFYAENLHLRQNASQIFFNTNGYAQYDTLISCRIDTANVGTRLGVIVSHPSWATTFFNLYMRHDTITNPNILNQGYDLLIVNLNDYPNHKILLDNCTFFGGYGVLVPSWGGNSVTSLAQDSIKNSHIWNGSYGIFLAHDGADKLTVSGTVISGHQYGGVFISGDVDSLYFVDDTVQNNGLSGTGNGVSISNALAQYNTFSRCIVSGNAGLAFDWVSGTNEGLTYEDGNLPVVSQALYDASIHLLRVIGTVPTVASNGVVEVYWIDANTGDPSGYGELNYYLGSGTASGTNFTIDISSIPAGLNVGDSVTVIVHTTNGSTSEPAQNKNIVGATKVIEDMTISLRPVLKILPMDHRVSFTYFPQDASPIELQLFSIDGRRIFHHLWHPTHPHQRLRVTSPELSHGVYFVRLISETQGGKVLTTRKFVLIK